MQIQAVKTSRKSSRRSSGDAWTVIFSAHEKGSSLDKEKDYIKFLEEAQYRNLGVTFLNHSGAQKILAQICVKQDKVFEAPICQYLNSSGRNDNRLKVFILDSNSKIRSILTYSSLETRNLADILVIYQAIRTCESPKKGGIKETLIAPKYNNK